MIEELKKYFEETPREKVLEDLYKSLGYDKVGITIDGFFYKEKHPKCKGDGIDSCGYNTTIECEECKYNGSKYGRKDPAAKCNKQ